MINKSSSRRPKRQVRNYSKYEELAERTGGLAVRTTRDRVEEVARMMEVEQYPAVRDISELICFFVKERWRRDLNSFSFRRAV